MTYILRLQWLLTLTLRSSSHSNMRTNAAAVSSSVSKRRAYRESPRSYNVHKKMPAQSRGSNQKNAYRRRKYSNEKESIGVPDRSEETGLYQAKGMVEIAEEWKSEVVFDESDPSKTILERETSTGSGCISIGDDIEGTLEFYLLDEQQYGEQSNAGVHSSPRERSPCNIHSRFTSHLKTASEPPRSSLQPKSDSKSSRLSSQNISRAESEFLRQQSNSCEKPTRSSQESPSERISSRLYSKSSVAMEYLEIGSAHGDDPNGYKSGLMASVNMGDRQTEFSRRSSECNSEKSIVKLHPIQSFRDGCGKFVNHDITQFFVIFLIVLNAIMLGLATFDFVEDDPRAQEAFAYIEDVFVILFTVEITLHFIHLGPFTLLKDPWLVFDLFVVITSWTLQSFQVVRAARIFRAVRLVARLSTLRNLAEAIAHVMPNMAAISALLGLLLYIYAVLCTILLHDIHEMVGGPEIDFFSSLDRTLLSLFEIMTLGWSGVVRPVMATPGYEWTWIIFISFIILSAFVMYNLIVAVVCDAVAVIELKNQTQNEAQETEGRPDCQRECCEEDTRAPGKLRRRRRGHRRKDRRSKQEKRVTKLRSEIALLVKSQTMLMESLNWTINELDSLQELHLEQMGISGAGKESCCDSGRVGAANGATEGGGSNSKPSKRNTWKSVSFREDSKG